MTLQNKAYTEIEPILNSNQSPQMAKHDAQHAREIKRQKIRERQRQQYYADIEKSRAIQRERSRRWRLKNKPERLPNGQKNTKWNVEAAKPQGIYHLKTKNEAMGLVGAIHRLGLYTKTLTTKQGVKVLKLKLANE
jgi:hypothetical protein